MADNPEETPMHLYVLPGQVKRLETTEDGVTRVWVYADDYTTLLKERDDLRRSLAVINAKYRFPGATDTHEVGRLLDDAGFHVADAKVMADLIRSVRQGTLTNP